MTASISSAMKFPLSQLNSSLVRLCFFETCSRNRYSTLPKADSAKAAIKQQPALFYSAVCLQRYAVTIPKKLPIEESFSLLMSKIEQENSKLSDHEIRHAKDLEKAERMRKGEEDVNKDENIVTAMDLEDAWENELAAFKPATTTTAVDLSSPLRHLDRKLFFVVKQKLGEDMLWTLPHAQRKGNESLRDTAQRIVKETYGNLKVHFNGNAPIGVYKYSFKNNGEMTPVKIFFYRAEIMENLNSLSNIVPPLEHMWLTSNEIKEYMPPRYAKTMDKFLLDL
jgi:large subunit ribosomal protein L46